LAEDTTAALGEGITGLEGLEGTTGIMAGMDIMAAICTTEGPLCLIGLFTVAVALDVLCMCFLQWRLLAL
jgi:hypothetical protein